MKIIRINDLLQVESPIIEEFLSAQGSFSSVILIADLNCGDTKTSSYTPSDSTNSSNTDFYIDTTTNNLMVKPNMFGLSAFIDGIYRLNLRMQYFEGETLYDSTCAFIDITYRCLLSNYLEGLLASEDTSSIAYLLHYALFNGSNCGCNCDELCEVFNALTEILTDTTTQTNNCGC